MQHKWAEPAWIAELPLEKRGRAKVVYYLNLAAAFCSENGALTDLSVACGLSRTALNVARARGRVSPEVAVKIESALGRDHFPRELFNDIFLVAEK